MLASCLTMKPRVEELLGRAENMFGLDRSVIIGRCREEDVVGVRWAIIWILLDEYGGAVSAIARAMGMKSPTVLHVKRCRNRGILRNRFLEKYYRALKGGVL